MLSAQKEKEQVKIEDMGAEAPIEPTLNHIVTSESLRWVFVGGKGGVGKTTISSSLATLIARHKFAHKTGRVLLVSTDPAHNISDAFCQKFGSSPTPVNGVNNLDAMEVVPKMDFKGLPSFDAPSGSPQNPLQALAEDKEIRSTFSDVFSSMPGIDEAMGFMQIMSLVKTLDYATVVFDTAPTGHTLHFLDFPNVMKKSMTAIQSKFSGLITQFSSMLGIGSEQTGKLKENEELIDEIISQFRNPDLTTFIPVMIPEFLSLYETERLLQELMNYGIDSSALVVNQLVCPSKDCPCALCNARCGMQHKYVKQINDLYREVFSIVLVPLQKHEIRGVAELTEFSQNLVIPSKEAHSVFGQ